MSLEICCQCESPTHRAGRGEDSLYTDNDWGPYCEDCWGDAYYWRCLTDEKVTEHDQLRVAVKELVKGLKKLSNNVSGWPEEVLAEIGGRTNAQCTLDLTKEARSLIAKHGGGG